MKTTMISTALIAIVALTACGKAEISDDALTLNMGTARENATANAKSFRSNVPAFAEWGVIPQGDSTQSKACPQGDGWASIRLIAPDSSSTTDLKCSTTSAALGCYLKSDFNSRDALAKQEGRCDTRISLPIKKLVE